MMYRKPSRLSSMLSWRVVGSLARLAPAAVLPFVLPWRYLAASLPELMVLGAIGIARLIVLRREHRMGEQWRWSPLFQAVTGISWGILIVLIIRVDATWATSRSGLWLIGGLLIWLVSFGAAGVRPIGSGLFLGSLGALVTGVALWAYPEPSGLFGVLSVADTIGALVFGVSLGCWWVLQAPARFDAFSMPGLTVPLDWRTDTRGRLLAPSPDLADLLPGLALARGSGDPNASMTLSYALNAPHVPMPDDDAIQHRLDARRTFGDHLQRVVGVDGAARWLLVSGDPVMTGSRFDGFRGRVRDVTRVVSAHRDVARRSAFDPLTGLASREAFFDDLAAHCVDGTPHALILFAFSGFRAINTELSHQVGDWLIEVMAQRLVGAVDANAVIGRVSGNCFAVLQPIEPGGAILLADRFEAVLRAPCLIDGMRLTVRVATGVAIYPEQGDTPETLFRRADLALLMASDNQVSGPVLFTESLERDYVGEIRLGGELARAIDTGEIEIALQPILDAGTGVLFAAEVLLRWPRPDQQAIAPHRVIALAEATGQIEVLGSYILREACFVAAEWDTPMHISVNLSPQQLTGGRFVDDLRAILAETGLAPRYLLLEVTEGVFLGAGPDVRDQLEAIRAMGVALMLDDFGTGFSSLIYLRDFETDGIKLDAGFIRDLPDASRSRAIVEAVQKLTCDLGMQLIAEGVETRAQSDWLLQHGIALQQGYYFAKPCTPEDFQARLAHARTLVAGTTAPADPAAQSGT
jgi:diguanylate cyclase (GGDEF)-like protein